MNLNRWVKLFIALIFLNGTIPILLCGQIVSPAFTHFTTEDGLPSSEVYSVLQDKKGNMWFGTDRGLVRYDGYNFRTYSYNDGLTDNTVFKLYEDSKERIWMLTYSGRMYYYENNKIISYKFNDVLFETTQSKVPLGFFIDSLENVFVSIRDYGIIIIDTNGKIIKKYVADSYPETNFLIDEVGTNFLLVALFRHIEKGKPCNVYHCTKNKTDSFFIDVSFADRITSIRITDGTLIFSLGKSLYQKSGNSVSLIKNFQGKVFYLYEDTKRNVWVGTEYGMFRFNQSEFSKTPIQYLEQNYITSIVQDNEGGYWFTTLNSGIFYMPGYGIEGIPFNTGLFQKPISLTSDFSAAVYAGCWSGTLVKIKEGKSEIVYYPGDERTLPVTNLTSFKGDPKIYVSRSLPGYFTENTFHLFKSNYLLGLKSDFLKRSDGSMVSAGTAFIFRNENDSILVMAITSQRINCLAETKDKQLLLGCNRGVFIYDDVSDSTKLYRKEFQNIRVDDMKWLNDKLLFATKGKGILMLVNDTIQSIDENDGLCSNLVNKLMIENNQVWCITNKGISRITFDNLGKTDFSITNIHNSDGLLSDEINDITQLNDTIYVATNTGISFFYSGTDFVNHTNPPVFFTSLRVNNSDTVVSTRMEFAHNLNNIQIGFNGISYRSREKIKYMYRLAKGSDTLTSETFNREVEFLSLNPGNYDFFVSAMNSSGVWSEVPAAFSFTILPAWWQTTWFRILLFIAASLGVYLFYRNKLALLKDKFEIERKQASLQLTAMRAQMNPHFIFNVMNSIRNYMQNHDIKSAEKYLTSFSKLVRYTLDNSEVQEVTLEEELNALRSYTELEIQRFENGFEFNIRCEEGIDLNETMLLSMLLQPFIENAIKHGIGRMKSDGKILIDVRKSKESIVIAIEDNGVGMQEASDWNKVHRESHTSHGTTLNLERIKAYNKVYNRNIQTRFINLMDNEGKSRGTRVEVEIN